MSEPTRLKAIAAGLFAGLIGTGAVAAGGSLAYLYLYEFTDVTMSENTMPLLMVAIAVPVIAVSLLFFKSAKAHSLMSIVSALIAPSLFVASGQFSKFMSLS